MVRKILRAASCDTRSTERWWAGKRAHWGTAARQTTATFADPFLAVSPRRPVADSAMVPGSVTERSQLIANRSLAIIHWGKSTVYRRPLPP